MRHQVYDAEACERHKNGNCPFKHYAKKDCEQFCKDKSFNTD